MNSFDISSIKFKFLSIDELVINLDRLSRFKLPEISYNRVFSHIILKYMIYPKYSKSDIENLSPLLISSLVQKIWNESVKKCCKNSKGSNYSYKILKFIINKSFKNIDNNTKLLIDTKLNISPVLNEIDYENSPYNLKFLIKANENIKSKEDFTYKKMTELREKYSLKLPIEKLLIVEGITEEILIPVFADKLNLNLDKKGIYILGAGGKSKSPSLYMQFKDKLKIPVILLFDFDAADVSACLSKSLKKNDKTFFIEKGEFEDILSINLIKRSLNNEYKPITPVSAADLNNGCKMCDNLEYFYKSRHLGEFKKSKLSKIIANNVKYNSDVTDEIKKIILNII